MIREPGHRTHGLDLRLHPKPRKDYWETLGEAGSFLPGGSNSGTEEGAAAGPTQAARTSYQPGAPSPRAASTGPFTPATFSRALEGPRAEPTPCLPVRQACGAVYTPESPMWLG